MKAYIRTKPKMAKEKREKKNRNQNPQKYPKAISKAQHIENGSRDHSGYSTKNKKKNMEKK